MKFLAILRDSVREALDAKVIYVLFVLSALVILIAFSLSFTPESGEDGVRKVLGQFEGGASRFGQRAPLSYTAENFTQLNPGARVWDGEYRYTLVVTQSRRRGEGDEDKDKEKDKEAKKEAKDDSEPSIFKMIVLFQALMNTAEQDLNDEDREARNRLREIVVSGGKDKDKGARRFAKEIERVSPGQMERFIRNELGAKGALEVTSIKLEMDTPREHRFAVECKAREGTFRTWPHATSLLFGALPLGDRGVGNFVYLIEDTVVGGWGAALCMLLGSIITAFFIPNMLRKGTIDLLLAKPIHRTSLLLFKFVGGLSFVFINLVVLIVGVWLALGLRSGLWSMGFLMTIFILTFQFAIFYALATLLGVVTRSPIVCILLSCLAWLVLWGVGIGAMILKPLSEFDVVPAWTYKTVNTARMVLPRYRDLDTLNSQLLAHDLLDKESPGRKASDQAASTTGWGEAISITLGHIAFLLALACWRFSVKDY